MIPKEVNKENSDFIFEIYEKGLLAGKEHKSPSPETEKQFAINEQRFNYMEESLEQIISEIKEIKTELTAQMEEIQGNIKPAVSAMEASRVLASFIKWTAGTILSMTAIWVFFKEIVKLASK